MARTHAVRYRSPVAPMKDSTWPGVLEWVAVAFIVIAVYAFIPLTA